MAPETNYEDMKSKIMEVIANYFRPEFINRIDETIVFHPLNQENIAQIADIQLSKLKQRLSERDISIEVTDEALAKLAAAGFDVIYGARPLKRAIQQYLENPLANQLLEGKFQAGDHITVSIKGDELNFSS